MATNVIEYYAMINPSARPPSGADRLGELEVQRTLNAVAFLELGTWLCTAYAEATMNAIGSYFSSDAKDRDLGRLAFLAHLLTEVEERGAEAAISLFEASSAKIDTHDLHRDYDIMPSLGSINLRVAAWVMYGGGDEQAAEEIKEFCKVNGIDGAVNNMPEAADFVVRERLLKSLDLQRHETGYDSTPHSLLATFLNSIPLAVRTAQDLADSNGGQP